jgi:hypothetical protein
VGASGVGAEDSIVTARAPSNGLPPPAEPDEQGGSGQLPSSASRPATWPWVWLRAFAESVSYDRAKAAPVALRWSA